MYKIYKEETREYDDEFLSEIEYFGALDYDKKEIIELLGPSIFWNEDKEQIISDLNTPGTILFRHYEHGKLHVNYTEKRLLATNDGYRQKKQLNDKINEFYGL
jgi:hypothetical protein